MKYCLWLHALSTLRRTLVSLDFTQALKGILRPLRKEYLIYENWNKKVYDCFVGPDLRMLVSETQISH